MKNTLKIIFGVFLVLIGTSLLIDRLGLILPFDVDVWRIVGLFWPTILVYWGVKAYMESNKTLGLILISLGSLLFLNDIFDYNFFSIFWPLLIITWGISIMVKKDSVTNVSSGEKSDDYIRETIAFWGSETKATSKNFTGGELNISFGGMELDLREIDVKKDNAKLHVNVAFGGADITVSKDCHVKTTGTGILGGWENNTTKPENPKYTLEIGGTALLGGVTIKN